MSNQFFPRSSIANTHVLTELIAALRRKYPYIFAERKDNRRTYFRNGFSAYLDCEKQLELCLPECESVYSATVCDRVGMQMLEEAAKEAEYELASNGKISHNTTLFIHKNNCALGTTKDHPIVTYGTHENYSVNTAELNQAMLANYNNGFVARLFRDKHLEWSDNISHLGLMLIPFLVSRQILCGAGNVVVSEAGARYEISQRSRFITTQLGKVSTEKRALVNTKEEHHARNYLRLHLICGDANMCSFSTYIKLGTTKIIIRMIEENALDPFLLYIPDALNVLHSISFDPSLTKTYKVVMNRNAVKVSAVDMQQCFLDAASNFVANRGGDEETKTVLERWQYTLDCLKNDPKKLCGKVDWITKKMLLDKIMESSGISLGSKKISDTNLMYHALHKSQGIFYKIEKPSWKVFDEEDVSKRTSTPPPTRALARLKTADALDKKIVSMSWDELMCIGNNEQKIINTNRGNVPTRKK